MTETGKNKTRSGLRSSWFFSPPRFCGNMKIRISRLSIIVFVVAAGFSLFGCASPTGNSVDKNYFEFDRESGTITGYDDDGPRDVTLPSSIDGIRVSAIGKNAFRGKRLTGASIFTSITTIGDGAFAENQLSSVTIGDSVITIGESAFENNRLETLIISDSVVIIRDKAFANNRLADVILGNGVESIGDEAFAVNGLSGIVIPNNISAIGGDAFSGNQIASVTIGPNKNYASNIVPNFGTMYNSNGKQAGIYTRLDSDTWIKQ